MLLRWTNLLRLFITRSLISLILATSIVIESLVPMRPNYILSSTHSCGNYPNVRFLTVNKQHFSHMNIVAKCARCCCRNSHPTTVQCENVSPKLHQEERKKKKKNSETHLHWTNLLQFFTRSLIYNILNPCKLPLLLWPRFPLSIFSNLLLIAISFILQEPTLTWRLT